MHVNSKEYCIGGRRVIAFSCVKPLVQDPPKEARYTFMGGDILITGEKRLGGILGGGLDEVAKRRRYWREASAVLRATRGSAALGKDSRLALNKDWSKEFRLPIGQGFPAAVRWVSVMLYYAARLPWLCVFKSTCIAHTEPDALCVSCDPTRSLEHAYGGLGGQRRTPAPASLQ